MRALMACLLVVSSVARAQTVEIDGQQVALGSRLKPAGELFEIKDLKFYEARVKGWDQTAVAVSGTLVSHLVHENHVVTIEIELYYSRYGHPGSHGAGKVTIAVERPMPNKAVRFVGCGRFVRSSNVPSDARLVQNMTVSYTQWRPTGQPEPFPFR